MNDSKYGTQCDIQTFTQEYSEVSLTRFETEEVQNHGHKQKELEIISRKIIRQVY